MIEVTEQIITALAPNSNAVKNGKKISQNGSFVKLMKSKDESIYMGECAGSGKKNYFTSADYLSPDKPVFRCSCPSRQFPCKHSIGLLFEILANKEFEISDIPEDIIKKREKIVAKANKNEVDLESLSEEEKEKLKKKAARAKKASNTARLKKAKVQLEGLDLVEKMLNSIVSVGLASITKETLDSLKIVSKEIGNYYLYGIQRHIKKLIDVMSVYVKKQDKSCFDEIIELVKKIWFITKKSKEYLSKKIESEDMSFDGSVWYEEIGNVWKITDLQEAGCGLPDGDFAQLAFYVMSDDGYKENIDNGVYIDLNSGEIYINKNIRPYKARKNVKQEDSIFGVIKGKDVVVYPGEGNKRIRWDGFGIREYEEGDYNKIISFAKKSVDDIIKEVKNVLKNPLAEKMYFGLLSFKSFGKTNDNKLVIIDKNDNKVLLSDMEKMDKSCNSIEIIPSNDYIHDKVILLGFFENSQEHRIEAQPFCIITKNKIVRLLY